ncbi:hypothetical protein [Deinococcus hopiensis]|uniref:hypothetical protein n=1 Tax=Deinococcus hopiensis TaxID=309885 RepID=UPI000A018587|nr:hypothetical protein [Deinococcus hopiensis]
MAPLEAVIGDGLRVFGKTSAALTEIWDRRLYRATFETFGASLEARWGFTRQRASQLITGARVAGAEKRGPLRRWTLSRNKFIHAAAGSEKPTTSQIKAVAEAVQQIGAAGVVEHPASRERVPFQDLPAGRLSAGTSDTDAYERVQRQEDHIDAGRMNGNGSVKEGGRTG